MPLYDSLLKRLICLAYKFSEFSTSTVSSDILNLFLSQSLFCTRGAHTRTGPIILRSTPRHLNTETMSTLPQGYDSEVEDRPARVILDMKGDFTLKDRPNLKFKLRDFNPQVKLQDGRLVPFEGLLPIRPIPLPTAVHRAKQLMGNGEHGIWTGTAFTHASGDHPPDHFFAPRYIATANVPMERFCIRRRHVPDVCGLKTMAIFTDGACLSNGSTAATPRGGCAFVFKPGPAGTVSFALENRGPDGVDYAHTNNRAELRAVIGALSFRVWWGEGWEHLVVITDSEYVANYATGWMRTWAERGWHTAAGRPVKNRDLWEKLSERMGLLAQSGCEVSFWTVPRRFNTLADRAAKDAAENAGEQQQYLETFGVIV
ncbi:hypothetical protein NKR23_g2940 [Pleurostoma richardsiae]|uniref:ribonuclease H n=1 Tax=Pleurostoma richardsiae TaxID=41990 RepID=A0AA38RN17_9PEZI|nr:hypothetical protein NKR23_g2940 [Pleurostoma richardsiae]